MERIYKAISLFSGAMGLDLGIEKAGFSICVCVEKDAKAARTIRANTDIPVLEKDISGLGGSDLLKAAGLAEDEPVDLVVGGPPCQAFSTAGRQRGLDDSRGNLILEYLRIVSEVRPAYFIMENVRGLLSASLDRNPFDPEDTFTYTGMKGGVLHFLLSQFKKIGYETSYALLNSANYGVPEKRERVFIIGHRGDRVPLPRPTHSRGGEYGTIPWVTLKEAIHDLETNDSLHYLSLRPKSIPFLKQLREGQNWRDLPEDQARLAMGKAYDLSGGKTGFLRRLSYSEPSPTLVTSPTMPATLLCHPTLLRPLAIEEYARIQQFPDHWKFCGDIVDVYRQIGNAVPVGLGYVVGRQVMRHIQGLTSLEDETQNHIPYSRYVNSTSLSPKLFYEPAASYKRK